jgi:2-polyprenyl-6-methoxyphenol hydroxylase-like FAD-dependent oxidoreductase
VMSDERQVTIIGAGIGGLALARACELLHIRCEVFEQAAEFTEAGAGLLVQPGALLALRRLGLEDAVRGAGREISAVFIKSSSGALLQELPLDFLRTGFDAPVVALQRARLHEVLLKSLVRTPVNTGARLVRVQQSQSGVRAEFADGRSSKSAILVGADGLRSTVRRELQGADPLRYAGYTSWRGIAALGQAGACGGEYWGAGERFGSAPIGARETLWFALANVPEGGVDADVKGALLHRYANWSAPIPELIDATPVERIIRADVFDRVPSRGWSRERMTLLGDAAHPATPNLALGACMAIEDAVTLARCLSSQTDHVPAFREYERKREPRTRRIVNDSWNLGKVAQLEGRCATRIRNLAFRLAPSGILRKLLRNAHCSLQL